jgi:hypothetical protein
MGQIQIVKFTSDGNAYNLDLGFIPAWARVINLNAADTEVYECEYFNQFGDSKEIWKYMITNDNGGDVATPVKKSSGGYISEYDSARVGQLRTVTFDYTGGAAEDLLTAGNAAHCPAENDKIKLVASGGLATGLSALLNYWVVNSGTYGAGTFQVALTKGGTAVEFTSDGTPTNYFINLSQQAPNIDGGKGITISASFMEDGDVIQVLAVEADRERDLGDVTV